MSSQVISIIAAMSYGRVIGKDNQMPWHLPADLQWFKRMTIGKPIIMGRRTYHSIGKVLPKRQNIIVSSNKAFIAQGCDVVHSPAEALQVVDNASEVMVIGGAMIYRLFLPYTKRLYLTQIDAELHGDTFFPDYEQQAKWTLLSTEKHRSDEKNAYHYSFNILERE